MIMVVLVMGCDSSLCRYDRGGDGADGGERVKNGRSGYGCCKYGTGLSGFISLVCLLCRIFFPGCLSCLFRLTVLSFSSL